MSILSKLAKRILGAALGLLLALPATTLRAEGPAPEADALADTYLLMDAATGQVLLGDGIGVMKYPASITKVVTLALVQQAINEGTLAWDANVTVSQAAMDALIPEASTAGLMAGETVSVRDLVQATQIRSANEAANVLAELLGGSIEGFAAMMNAVVADLGLEGTHFTNPSGLPDRDHYTTAYDMGQLTRWAMAVPGFMEIMAATEYTMGPTNMYNGERGFFGTNSMWHEESDYYYEGLIGAKSGYTDAAGYTLVSAAQRDGITLICVVLRCENNDDKYVATGQLFDYGFDNFSRVEFPLDNLGGIQVPVYGGGEDSLGDITVHGADSISFLLHHGLTLDAVQEQYDVPERYVLGAPFTPAMSLQIGDGSLQFAEGIDIPLAWEGLEGVFTANTDFGWTLQDIQTRKDYSDLFNTLRVVGLGLLLLLALAVLCLCARVVYVHHRRRQMLQRKLIAQRTQMAQNRARVYHKPQVAPRAPAARHVKNPAANQRRPAVHLTVVSRAPMRVPQGRAVAPRAGQR